MRDGPYETWKAVHHGRAMTVEIYPDHDMGAPWKEHDGHGPMRDAFQYYGHPSKRPGETVVYSDRGDYWLYDFEEATKIAKRDGWGVGIDGFMALTAKLRRCPTRGQCVRVAVIRDLKLIRGWLNEDWWWVGVVVRDDETGDEESLWGIESDADDYIRNDVFDELASQLHPLAEAQECADLDMCTD